MLKLIEAKVKELEPLLINIRRYLHQNPELSGKEYNTTNFINNKLTEAGIHSEIITTDAGPAVIAYIGNDKSKKTIALRADIDALPLTEKEKLPYCSKVDGVMHACGHDFNMTSVLGAGFILASFIDKLEVNIKLIFQPSEETAQGGARAVVKTGVLQDTDAIFTVHALPGIDAGKIGIKSGIITAAIDMFKISTKGSGGHSARPHLATDAIFITNQVLNILYSDITRHFDPIIPVVLSIGSIKGGSAPNIISDSCEIEGTVRTFDENLRTNLKDLIYKRVEETTKMYGATSEIYWHSGPSSVNNDISLSKLTEKSANEILGAENVVIMQEPSMGAEDFSQYLDNIPGMLIRIGTGGENCCHPLHSCQFKINENAIGVAVKVLTATVLNYNLSAKQNEELLNKDV